MSYVTSFFDTGMISLIISILVPFGAAMFFFGSLHSKLNTTSKDVEKLKTDIEEIKIRLEAHLLSMDELSESDHEEKV